MRSKNQRLPTKSTDTEVNAFLQTVTSMQPPARNTQCGRLIFAMDATASRESTWDQACQIQAEMFTQTSSLGGLEIQLCYYRGFLEFEATSWFTRSAELLASMSHVRCAGGTTQIARVLEHAIREKQLGDVKTLVFVGDCVEERVDRLCELSGVLGMLGVPLFVFQEADDSAVERTFREMARLSKGVFCRFDSASPKQLRELLGAAAVYAAGGRQALEQYTERNGSTVRSLTRQLGTTN